MFGRLSLESFQHDFIQNSAVYSMVLGGIAILAAITYFKKWKYLWNEWITTVDPKRIGVMYMIVMLIMFAKGFSDASLMRTQQVTGVGDNQGILHSEHFQEIFSAHGTAMIFFVAMGFVFGILNLVVPLQIGARDVAYPFLNALGFWLFASGATLVLVSLAIGHFSISGWLAYPPLSGLKYSPNEGTDYWIWMVQIAGIGSTMSAINFIMTILKMRCPGMTFFKMPIFVWSALCSMILVLFAFPILTATLYMLTLDRYLGMHFFTSAAGGSPMLYINLIWAWGHPEVYILILPAFGIFSEIIATFSKKTLFGYTSMVWALILITFFSFIVWVHHFFTMGASPGVNVFFAIMTMLIAIPTGVKIFNWLYTQYRGKVDFNTPMLWFFAFVLNFIIAGMTGVLLSSPPVDFQLHNSLFLVAHFHGMVIGGVLFGLFAGFTYWFPKYTGFYLNEKWNWYAFWCWFAGFLIAFMPLYMLGFMGATRRLDHYPESTGWYPLFVVVWFGAAIIFVGASIQLVGLFQSIWARKKQAAAGDPWDGRTLEWSTTSPPPVYNFAVLPHVTERDHFWEMKQGTVEKQPIVYEDIHLPKNTPVAFLMGACALIFGFAMTWFIWWLAIASGIGLIGLLIMHLSYPEQFEVIPAAKVKEMEEGR